MLKYYDNPLKCKNQQREQLSDERCKATDTSVWDLVMIINL